MQVSKDGNSRTFDFLAEAHGELKSLVIRDFTLAPGTLIMAGPAGDQQSMFSNTRVQMAGCENLFPLMTAKPMLPNLRAR